VRYFALVNKLCDDIAKSFATSRSALEVAFFKLIIEKIVEDGIRMTAENADEIDRNLSAGCKGTLSVLEAKNLRMDLPESFRGKMNAYGAERAIEGFVDENWFIYRGKGRIEIGARTYMELPELLNRSGMEEMPQIVTHLSR